MARIRQDVNRIDETKSHATFSQRAYFAFPKSLFEDAKEPILDCERAYLGTRKSLFWKMR